MDHVTLDESPFAPGRGPARIRVRRWGRGKPVVLLHGGWGYDAYPFDRQAEALALRFRVLAPDRTGYGQSGRLPDLPQDFHRLAAEETLRVLDALRIREAVLWGHSDGAVVAGISVGVITATVTGERIIFARSGTDLFQDNATVTFLAGPPDATRSNLAVSRGTAPADGATPVSVTVTVRDAFSNPVPAATVVISATSHAQVTQPVTVTNASGQTVGAVTDIHG